jgi:hypothetical protein
VSGPHEDAAILIYRTLLPMDEFVLQDIKGFVIEVELQLEGTIRHTTAPLQHVDSSVKELLEGHPVSFQHRWLVRSATPASV